MLVVKDLDFVTYIFVENFQNFTDRGIVMRAEQEHASLGKSVTHSKGANWRRMRGCISQAFTSNKLKHMMQELKEPANLFLELMGNMADTGRECAIFERLQGLAMDYTARAAFGFDCCFQRDLSHPFMITTRKVLHGVMTGPFHVFAHSTTTLVNLVAPILWLKEKLGSSSSGVFNKETTKVVELRLRNPEARKPDLLQIMLDASIQKKHSSDAGEKTKGSMTRLEVEVNTTMTLLAGFETTSTALTYVSYVLAKYQDIQEKVRAEVASAVEEYGELNYDSVMLRMKYLRRVVDETLRIYPPGTVFTTRRALNDFDYNGIKFKAGTSFMAPTLQIHMDLRYWPEPHRFDPDRFLPENASSRPSVAYQPFGVGPRNCFGERLAILEIMYTMARMVEKYRLTLGESQKNDLELCFRATVSAPREGPYIKFQRI
ncbi:lithocholate 6-beta-hydroxylase isoform X2 [Dermacentor silvarum]|nr:lithocholate 6-beta-hydroxylase isoform X2 [Dermacentor silvarum]